MIHTRDADFTGCAVAAGYVNRRDGYARVYRPGLGMRLAHRVAWEEAVGPIPSGYEIHHICRTRACLRVDHMVLVTPQEHKAIEQAERTHCRRGHPYALEAHVRKDGRRYCLRCERDNRRRRAALR